MKRTLVLEGEQPRYSWNDLNSRVHWSKRDAEARRCKQVVRACLDPELPPFTRPVDITTTVYFEGGKHKALDSDNIPDKLYLDGLIGWWFDDDSPLYVRSARTVSRIDRHRPRVEIECEELPETQPETGPASGLNGCMFSCNCGKKFRSIKQLLEHRDEGTCYALDRDIPID